MAEVTPPGGAGPAGEGEPNLQGNLLQALLKVRNDLSQASPDLQATAEHIKALAQAARAAQQAGG